MKDAGSLGGEREMINWDRIHKLGAPQQKPAPAPGTTPVVPTTTDPRRYMRNLGRNVTKAVGPTKPAKPDAGPAAPDPRIQGYVDWAEDQRERDMQKGKEWGEQYYGAGNPEIKAIMDLWKNRATGMDPTEVNLMRERGTAGINQQLATNMRALRGLQATNGVRGGAAIGQALPAMTQANQARAGLERDIALTDMARRDAALRALESTVTGERQGLVGSQLGWAGMGATDRSTGLGYVLSKDEIERLRGLVNDAANPLGSGAPPWLQKQMEGLGDILKDPNKLLEIAGNLAFPGVGLASGVGLGSGFSSPYVGSGGIF